MSEECCGTCRFARIQQSNVKEIECRRYPYTVNTVLVADAAGRPMPVHGNVSPTMESNNWCGEYQPKKSVIQ